MAREFAARVEAREGLALAASVRLNTVCLRLSSDAATRLFHESLNATGEVFLTHAMLDGRYIVRVSFGQTNSTWDTMERLWTLVEGTLARPPYTLAGKAGGDGSAPEGPG
jgi:glutamate/tyrosine decarboxylase-like PLP-dependent enzyme